MQRHLLYYENFDCSVGCVCLSGLSVHQALSTELCIEGSKPTYPSKPIYVVYELLF